MCYFHKHLNLNYNHLLASNSPHSKILVAYIIPPIRASLSLPPLRADVSTSPEFNLSRGGEDTRRKDSHIATFQPSRENRALPRISWIIFKPEIRRRFLHSPLPGASIAVLSSRVSPQRVDTL